MVCPALLHRCRRAQPGLPRALRIAAAQTYPNRPIRLLHGFAAGGAADTMARIVSDGLSKRLGQPVIVEAKPGAGGNLAADAVAKSAPDGYTIGLVTGAHAISGALYKQLAYSPTDSFDMLSTMVYYALVIAVRADHKAKTLADLIAIAKAKPDDLSYGSVGFGSTHHLAGELLNITAGTKMVHVPYRGDSLTVTSLLAGDVPVIVGTTVLLAGQIESGAIRGLAVTSPARTHCCRTCRPRRKPASRVSMSGPGRGYWSPRARRPTSSSGSTRRSSRCWPTPRRKRRWRRRPAARSAAARRRKCAR